MWPGPAWAVPRGLLFPLDRFTVASRVRGIGKFLHFVFHVMAAANPEHLAEVGQGRLGAEEFPSEVPPAIIRK